MKNHNRLLDELLDIYADRIGLAVLITDCKGELAFSPKGDNGLCDRLLHRKDYGLHAAIRETLNGHLAIDAPIVIEILPGIYTIVAKIKENFFLLAGFMVKGEAVRLIKDSLANNYSDQSDWKRILNNTPVLTVERKRRWFDLIENLVYLLDICLSEEGSHSSFQIQSEFLEKAFREEALNINALFHKFIAEMKGIEFVGMAEQQDYGTYKINHLVGESIEKLAGTSFSPGEGFLGRVPVSGEKAVWENIEKDPRVYFFQKHLLCPASLLCYPVKRRDGSISIFFAGKLQDGRIKDMEAEIVWMFASLLEKSLLTQDLYQENLKQFQQLSAFTDITTMLANTSGTREIAFVLVDICSNMTKSNFSCFVSRNSRNGKEKMVSRGKYRESYGRYVTEVFTRYYENVNGSEQHISLEKFDKSDESESFIIECPIRHQDNLVGVLCTETNATSKNQINEEMRFLQTLSIIGGAALHASMQEDAETVSKQVSTLFLSIEQFDKEAYLLAQKAEQLACVFTQELELEEKKVQLVVNGCRLSFFEPAFIKKIVPNSDIDIIVQECRDVIDGRLVWSDVRMESRVLIMIGSYLAHGNINSIRSYSLESDVLIEKFIHFILGRKKIKDGMTFRLESDPIDPMKYLGLSPREEEVLNLIVQGLNNRQIAESLFISGHTVKNHVTKILQKMHVTDRAQAISKVYELKYKHVNYS